MYSTTILLFGLVMIGVTTDTIGTIRESMRPITNLFASNISFKLVRALDSMSKEVLKALIVSAIVSRGIEMLPDASVRIFGS